MRSKLVDIENKAESDKYNLHFDSMIVKYVMCSKITHACYTFDKMKDVINFMNSNTYRYHGYDNYNDFALYAGRQA
jgi:hypothetical protein